VFRSDKSDFKFLNCLIQKNDRRFYLSLDSLAKENETITALIDNGATVSVFGVIYMGWAEKSTPSNRKQYSGALVKLYKVNQNIRIGLAELHQDIKAYVSEQTNYDLVLGIDWFSKSLPQMIQI
jgi:hypothetical protein